MRKTCLDMVHRLARRDERVVFVGSDLGPGVLQGMKDEMPERFYMEGVSEANVIGLAAGLALEGFVPYVNTIATFLTRRCFEQIAIDLCLHNLPVRLIAVLGLAENAVGSRAYRPGDILRSKSGLTIEITNTDAEGRVVLADALVLAREFEPDYLVDFATLTGACRIALGKEVMGLFCDDPALTAALRQSGEFTGDAVWPLPLWAPHKKKMESQVADLVNAAPDGMAGAVTAALFLQEFAGPVAWAHLDCYAWSDGDSPLFPKGGSGVGIRLMADFVERLING